MKAWWDKLDPDKLFDQIEVEEALPFPVGGYRLAMVAGRLCDPASKRATHRWVDEHVVAPDGFGFPTLEQ